METPAVMLADHLLVLRHQPWERDRAQFIAGILFIAVTLVLARTRKPVVSSPVVLGIPTAPHTIVPQRLVSDIINTVKQRLRAWAYLFNGPTIIQNAYSQVSSTIFRSLRHYCSFSEIVSRPTLRSLRPRHPDRFRVFAQTYQGARSRSRYCTFTQSCSETGEFICNILVLVYSWFLR